MIQAVHLVLYLIVNTLPVGVPSLHVIPGVSASMSPTSTDNVDSRSFFVLLPSLKIFVIKVNLQGTSRPPCGKSEE